MNDILTLRVFVASEVRTSTTARGTSTASFRLGTTERRYDRASNTWVDGNTNWYTVQSFRYLAAHVGCSVKKGQRVIVLGRLRLRQWEHEGKVYHVAEVDAEAVGHDLMWGSANFTRMNGTSAPAESVALQPQDAAEAPAPPASEAEWESTPESAAPPEDDDVVVNVETGEGMSVNPRTGELVDATA